MNSRNLKILESLPIWKGSIETEKLDGGITNNNFIVNDQGKKYVVRIGNDIPEHLIFRSNELFSSQAAAAIGVSPRVVYQSKGVLVLDYIKSKTLTSKDIPMNMHRIIPLIKEVHKNIPNHLNGSPIIFWVFHVIRHYSNFLNNNNSIHTSKVEYLINCNNFLESISAPHYIVYGHNDLLAANFLDDGKKLWLVDWEYSGFNDPMFDLGGLASNNNFREKDEILMLEEYFEKNISDQQILKYNAMKTASLLRETMWSMVSEITSKIDFDYSEYTAQNLDKFESSFNSLKS